MQLSGQSLSAYTSLSFDLASGNLFGWAGVYMEYGMADYYEACSTIGIHELNGASSSTLVAITSFCSNGTVSSGWVTSAWLPDVPATPEREYVARGTHFLTLTTQVDPLSPEAQQCFYPTNCWYDIFGFSSYTPVTRQPWEPAYPVEYWFAQAAPVLKNSTQVLISDTTERKAIEAVVLTITSDNVTLYTTGQSGTPVTYIQNQAGAGAPRMPALLATLSKASPAWTADWRLEVSYSRPDTGCAGRQNTLQATRTETTSQVSTVAWNITQKLGASILGGNARVSFTIKGIRKDADFRILGTNPSEAQIKNYLYGQNGPWFRWIILKGGEAVNGPVYQFNTSGSRTGEPNYGGPCGFGIGQIDPPGPVEVLWDWQANARAAIAKIAYFRPFAEAGWSESVQAFKGATGGTGRPPCRVTEGAGPPRQSFDYYEAPHDYGFSDLIWISMFNRGQNGARYIRWDNTNGQWTTSRCTWNSGMNPPAWVCYADRTCGAPL